MNAVSVQFSLEELWYMRSRVRHVVPNEEQWRSWPPASLELNEEICNAILVMEESIEQAKGIGGEPIREYSLSLSKGDCLLLDFVIDQDAATGTGSRIGKSILLKVMKARRELAGGPVATVQEPAISDIDEKIAEWKESIRRKPRRKQ